MAFIYYECDGADRRAMTVNLSLGATTYYRQYTVSSAVINESYKKLTITLSQAPLSEAGLRVYYSYETRRRVDGGTWSTWATVTDIVTVPQGQTSIQFNVPITQDWYIYQDGITPDQTERSYV